MPVLVVTRTEIGTVEMAPGHQAMYQPFLTLVLTAGRCLKTNVTARTSWPVRPSAHVSLPVALPVLLSPWAKSLSAPGVSWLSPLPVCWKPGPSGPRRGTWTAQTFVMPSLMAISPTIFPPPTANANGPANTVGELLPWLCLNRGPSHSLIASRKKAAVGAPIVVWATYGVLPSPDAVLPRPAPDAPPPPVKPSRAPAAIATLRNTAAPVLRCRRCRSRASLMTPASMSSTPAGGSGGAWAVLICATVTGILLDVNLDRDDPAPLHEQVAAEIRRSITDGDAKPGDRLPPARHLAAVMGVNTNTVFRALRALRDEGLLEMAPRRGIRVVGTPAQSEIRNKVAELVQLARQQGYTRKDLTQMITDAP